MYLFGCSSDRFRITESTITREMTRGAPFLNTRTWKYEQMRPLTQAMSQSAKQKDSENILTFTENENTRISSDFRFKKLTAKAVILYFLVPRNLSDYVKHKALWDCKRRLSQTPSGIDTWQRTTGGRTARGKFFSPSLVIMISALQMRPIILLCYMSRGQKRAFTTQGFLNTTLIIESRTRSILS